MMDLGLSMPEKPDIMTTSKGGPANIVEEERDREELREDVGNQLFVHATEDRAILIRKAICHFITLNPCACKQRSQVRLAF